MSLRRDSLLFAVVLVLFGIYQDTVGFVGEPFAVAGLLLGAIATVVSLVVFLNAESDD